MGMFKRSEPVRASKIAVRARFVSEDAQRVDVEVRTLDGEKATIDLSLDQVRALVAELSMAYSACRPELLDLKRANQIAGFFGMR